MSKLMKTAANSVAARCTGQLLDVLNLYIDKSYDLEMCRLKVAEVLEKERYALEREKENTRQLALRLMDLEHERIIMLISQVVSSPNQDTHASQATLQYCLRRLEELDAVSLISRNQYLTVRF